MILRTSQRGDMETGQRGRACLCHTGSAHENSVISDGVGCGAGAGEKLSVLPRVTSLSRNESKVEDVFDSPWIEVPEALRLLDSASILFTNPLALKWSQGDHRYPGGGTLPQRKTHSLTQRLAVCDSRAKHPDEGPGSSNTLLSRTPPIFGTGLLWSGDPQLPWNLEHSRPTVHQLTV